MNVLHSTALDTIRLRAGLVLTALFSLLLVLPAAPAMAAQAPDTVTCTGIEGTIELKPGLVGDLQRVKFSGAGTATCGGDEATFTVKGDSVSSCAEGSGSGTIEVRLSSGKVKAEFNFLREGTALELTPAPGKKYVVEADALLTPTGGPCLGQSGESDTAMLSGGSLTAQRL